MYVIKIYSFSCKPFPMKYIKSTDEEVNKMCNIVEEYVAERLAESEAARAEAKAATSKLDSIKNLMKNMHWSPEEAMCAIGIPKTDYTRYLAML